MRKTGNLIEIFDNKCNEYNTRNSTLHIYNRCLSV